MKTLLKCSILALFCLAVSCTKASSPNCVMLDGKQVCSLGSAFGSGGNPDFGPIFTALFFEPKYDEAPDDWNGYSVYFSSGTNDIGQFCDVRIQGVPEVAPNLPLSVVVENGKVVAGGETVARLDVRKSSHWHPEDYPPRDSYGEFDFDVILKEGGKITVRYSGPLRNGGVI